MGLTRAEIEIGGSDTYSGVSTSRTLMLAELSALLAATPPDATRDDYRGAVVAENVLLKPSAGTRAKTYSYLRDRFALDPAVPIFCLLRLLWDRDPAGRATMTLFVAALRDPVLRATVPALLALQPDQPVSAPEFAAVIADAFPDKLNDITLKATAERLMSTYAQSGHLAGSAGRRARRRVTATPGGTTVALLLATLGGAGGKALLDTNWVRLLDAPDERVLAEARVAAERGWLEYRHAGDVLEITFRRLLATVGGDAEHGPGGDR